MKNIREMIRSILRDDALYRRRDLPGDVDDPPEDCGCGGCEDCQGEEDEDDFVTAKYALYSAIAEAINVYDSMEGDFFEDDDSNAEIEEIARRIKRLKH